jgi:hypothetical protein
LPCAGDLLDHRQTRYAVRALSADGDHPTHQLLPTNFRLGELYRHEGATGQQSSTGWTRPEKTHRLLGSRLAQQVVKHVSYDTEYGYELPYKEAAPEAGPVTRTNGYLQMPGRMLPDHPQQMTLFVQTTKDASFGVGAAWKERNGGKTKAASLGKHLTEMDAALFEINMVGKDLLSNQQRAEIVTNSRLALTELQSTRNWVLPIITEIKRQAKRVEEEGGRVSLTWLPSSSKCEGYKAANAAAQRAARQQPKVMRSASLSFVKLTVKEKWKTTTKLNKHIQDARKSVAARYLQLKSNHTVTGVYLLRINKVQDARCWWCSGSKQTVAHLMLECRKWRRERETMLQRLSAKNVTITGRRDRGDLETLFEQVATVDVLQYIESTEVSKKLPDGVDKCNSWDIERLDREDEESAIGDEDR